MVTFAKRMARVASRAFRFGDARKIDGDARSPPTCCLPEVRFVPVNASVVHRPHDQPALRGAGQREHLVHVPFAIKNADNLSACAFAVQPLLCLLGSLSDRIHL